MGTEAQKLISVSLEKIASCRRRRREMSLHKNLLVTTVIHKARLAIMEETYYMMSTYGSVDNGVLHRDYHVQQAPSSSLPTDEQDQQQQQASYYNNNNEVTVSSVVLSDPDYASECPAPLTPAPALLLATSGQDGEEVEEEEDDYLPHHYDLDRDVNNQPGPQLPEVVVAAPLVVQQQQLQQPIITGPALSAALVEANAVHHHHHHQMTQSSPLTTLTDCCSTSPMDWEGEHAMAVALRCSNDLHGLCSVRLEPVELVPVDEMDDDKENLSPIDAYALSCCGGDSGAASKFLGRLGGGCSISEHPCGGATTTTITNSAGSTFVASTTTTTTTSTTTTMVAPRLGQKRNRGCVAAEDDDVAKRCKWDTTTTITATSNLCADLVVDCRGADDSDDTSHALRLVSVLSASLGGGISPAPTTVSSSSASTTSASNNSSTSGATCAGRLVRSNSTDLCSKQAKDTLELVGRSPALAIAV